MDSMVTKRSKGIENPGFLDIEIDEETILPIDSVRKRMGQVKSPGNGVVEETGIQETRNGNNEVRERETIEEAENPRNGRERKGETVAHDAGVEVRERESEMVENHRNGETPPDDDCCSICFGDFDIPCKTNCGHWFCARCILMLWNYGRALQRCKCPICTRCISELTPEASLALRQEEEVVEALKKVERYNRLYVGGARGLMMKVHELPLLFRRCLGEMIDPNRLRFNYYTARLIALLLAILYEVCGFDFIPTGRLGAARLFQYSAMAVVLILFAVGLVRRFILYLRVRRLAALQQ
ncbi:uncharacterized protein LOC131326865 isoform X1 [Rhododendron vialii]|uniref:uncharacterized protein LOC131326865 isoform X1 n=1 Tax=Rhododendron vialii TaxID=182163 RepID=UPI0026604B60|nr:uncharacterized protein LOC131326865 isoform X1 [Rhododendron vialii]